MLDAFLADPARMHATADQIREQLMHAAPGSNEVPDLDASELAAGEKRKHRREQVRRRVEDVLGKALREAGTEYVLPDDRLVATYYSKIHNGGAVWLGVQTTLKTMTYWFCS